MINPNDVLTYEQLKARVIELESKLLANREAQSVNTGIFTREELAEVCKARVRDMPENYADHQIAKVALNSLYTAPPAPVVNPEFTGATAVPEESDPRDEFESVFPMPKYVVRCGAGYAVTAYSAWGAHDFNERWVGWNACRAAMLAQDTQPPTDNTQAQFEALAPKQPFKIGDIVRQHIIGNRYDYAKVIYADPCGALDVKEIGTGLCFGWSASMCELAPCKDA